MEKEIKNQKLRVLFVCSKNSGKVVPFIEEQAESLRRQGHQVEFFLIEGKGISGYLKNYRAFRSKLHAFGPEIVHAHYGLSCLFANLQRRVPVVSTYHGSDINQKKVYRFSRIAIQLSASNVFVSEKTRKKTPQSLKMQAKSALIPCGVDTTLFVPMDSQEARKRLKLDTARKYVLFAGAFGNGVKNAALAQEAMALIPEATLIELKGYSRQEVMWLMNAVDAVLMTSFSEGSPQFIKEAMACNCPLVSVPVGDVPELVQEVEGCVITGYEATQIADALQSLFRLNRRTEGRSVLLAHALDLRQVALKIEQLYLKVLNTKK